MKKLSFFALVLIFQFTQAQFRFLPTPDASHYPERSVVTPIVANVAYQGYDETQAYFGEGEYEIFLDLVNGVLDQPIIVLDGFDPGDGRDIGALYASLSFDGDNLADILRAEGYDIVILNAPQYTTDGKDIDGGGDYIQRNGLVLAALIEEINAQKVGNAELVVLGPSMGGLIARYGLAYMEANSIPHETRLYISFDSPHRGANIPISLQYLINYFAQQNGDPQALAIVDGVLNSPAAKEMLIDHYTVHLLNGSTFEQDPNKLLPAGAEDFRDAFQTELDALGFPQEVRNVTMINGNANGIGTGLPGAEIVNTNLVIDALTDVDVALYFTPEANQTNTVTDLTAYFIGIPVGSYSTEAQQPAEIDGVDASPGGTGSIADALGDGGGNPVLEQFIAALQQELYSFIPTMSALAIENSDWFATPNLNDSPFVNTYIPSENEPHVTVTAESAAWALNEIRLPLGVSENTLDLDISLVENPVKDAIRLSISPNSQISNLSAQIFSLTGEQIASKIWNQPQGELVWKQQLPTGIYILAVSDGKVKKEFKVVVQ
ncbi:MAG: T9SS type A sorting domain-containing protein [Flavobacteriaceae bacterium]|nr:T9SS type A sorting domain-containing protein [Flavobacteriaceae bacterium]